LSGLSERVQLDRRDWIAAGVVVDQSLRRDISRCDPTVREPQGADDENSLGRIASGEIDENSRRNGSHVDQWRWR
jgi:hypothetical protein